MTRPKRTLQAKLGTDDPGSLFFELPFDVKATFGKARPPLKVTVNGHTWRTTPAVYGGRTYVPVRASNRDAARVAVGQTITATLELDTEPRVVKPPRDLAVALAKNARARAGWAASSFSHRKEHADAIAGAKKPETRAARVRKALAMLEAKSPR